MSDLVGNHIVGFPTRRLTYSSSLQKLKKDRDFRVNAGGFCPRKVTELKHVPGERFVGKTVLLLQCSLTYFQIMISTCFQV